MALGKKCRNCFTTPKRSNGLSSDHNNEEEALEFGLVKYARAFGRKRIVISNNGEDLILDSIPKTPLKKHCSQERLILDHESSPLEALPTELLVSPKFLLNSLSIYTHTCIYVYIR